ncbi:MAG TPA: hypothetical protein VMU22_01085 [Rhizomicrobium sp.]|nr:hypothetical protein [Rhizomicrobium sp.]
MLFRAIFWIGVVAVLLPREPDLGLPRSARALLPGMKNDTSLDCRDYVESCTAALGVVDTFQSVAVRSLARVKADIEADERAHPSD